MRLDEFEQEQVSRIVRYTIPVPDDRSEAAYELVIVGREEQVGATFGESEIEAKIRPGVTEDEWTRETQRELEGGPLLPREALHDPRAWVKPAPTDLSADIMMTLRAVKPGATGFLFTVTGMTVFSRTVFAVGSGSRMAWVAAQSRPSSGDPDLFLLVGRVPVTGVFSSTAPGLVWDTVFATATFGFGVPFVPLIVVVPFISPSTTTLFVSGWAV